ncbi:ead/Ea22-like family protein [Citrobacter freundii]|uniref:Ead/Ea22-like family protein n=1 Tax=Citrobacter freundii TaxID=546 RepID=A0AAP5XT93_CITFR|nr:ead/Ea22-like family protein [Citrobacter freundii]MCW0941910.1 ead/Ea22-like family protein [Citrobacter freundii]MCY3415850.1 hypothetical protein [Citrobacter freundii]MDV2192279.1 ead/Ea22-like family protein [Citrobacter freundii]MDW2758400.1 ead/Ea22-like family protein [Citrobacter freundii]MEB0534558.1 ead/Ea22-like family protein [Citrobacter freundii]
MTELNKQALRGQSVEGSYYLAECGHCGEMYPSNKLDGGEPLFSGDYGECFCHLCGADDSDIADNGAWGSEAVIAWNYQQKRIEALLDELEASEKRIADQRGIILSARKFISEYAVNGDHGAAEFVKILDRAAGIGVKVE